MRNGDRTQIIQQIFNQTNTPSNCYRLDDQLRKLQKEIARKQRTAIASGVLLNMKRHDRNEVECISEMQKVALLSERSNYLQMNTTVILA